MIMEEAVDKNATCAVIDEVYEFSAPQFFDFINGEVEEDERKTELWFESALSYAPSPCMPKIKTRRSFKVESLCDFSEVHRIEKQTTKSSDSNGSEMKEGESKEEHTECIVEGPSEDDEAMDKFAPTEPSVSDGEKAYFNERIEPANKVGNEACTPKAMISSYKREILTNSKKHQTAKKIASLVKNPSSALKPKLQSQSSQTKSMKTANVKRETNARNTVGPTNIAQENQAIKRQKLEGGRSRQILSVKSLNLPHKSKPGLTKSCPSSTANKTNKVERKVYIREPEAPFVSMAEMMKKFQSRTRDLSLTSVNNSSLPKMKPKLTLTRPKEPEFETAQRVRSVRVKSTAELAEEMMAKIPKFKARPVNKKILEAPTLPALKRSTPQPPEFQEFHFKTMERANNNLESASIASTEMTHQKDDQWKPHLTEPRTPLLHTFLRARPPRVKSSFELEQEELEKIPKFKARPLNKKILESKGEMGLFSSTKKHVTVPQEFHFATNERIRQPPSATSVFDLFDKLSICSEKNHENTLPRNTKPNPFHLRTEERGAEKEKKFYLEFIHKQMEEERARIPRATPYPYTTDYPVIPSKPEPKQCTRAEPFQLESLVRHEEEMQREMEERCRTEREEEERRIFKAQPILKEDPIPVPEKERKPLTQVQEFNLHVDHRAVERFEFDQKIKEKEMIYKRYREESEAARLIEEEKVVKQMRRTMVPHAKPMPKFDNPFFPEKSSKGTTKPKSPKLRVLQRKERRRMVKAATSSAASNMR